MATGSEYVVGPRSAHFFTRTGDWTQRDSSAFQSASSVLTDRHCGAETGKPRIYLWTYISVHSSTILYFVVFFRIVPTKQYLLKMISYQAIINIQMITTKNNWKNLLRHCLAVSTLFSKISRLVNCKYMLSWLTFEPTKYIAVHDVSRNKTLPQNFPSFLGSYEWLKNIEELFLRY